MYIHVKVQAGSKRERFEKLSITHFEIWVKEKAEKNRANGRVLELVAKHFGVPSSAVRIISGHHSPSKMLDIKS